jgi:hypothetical protein
MRRVEDPIRRFELPLGDRANDRRTLDDMQPDTFVESAVTISRRGLTDGARVPKIANDMNAIVGESSSSAMRASARQRPAAYALSRRSMLR